MIETIHLTKTFGNLVAVNDISLSVPKGSIYGLVGPNGSGKTTLLKHLAGIYRQDDGDVLLNGKPIYENPEAKAKIGYLSDQPLYHLHYTTEEMAKLYSRIYPNWDYERYHHLKRIFQFSDQKKIRTLSKGMQKQATFWLTLCKGVEVLVLDEPIDGLDPMIRKQVRDLMIEDVTLKATTIIISSHNLRELEDLCDHIAIIENGQLILDREMNTLKNDLHKIQVAYQNTPIDFPLHDLDTISVRKTGSVYTIIARGNRREIFESVQATHPVVCDFIPLSLEEIFIYEVEGAQND
jgi:ABC-2 type transport system ATP-binding protein